MREFIRYMKRQTILGEDIILVKVFEVKDKLPMNTENETTI